MLREKKMIKFHLPKVKKNKLAWKHYPNKTKPKRELNFLKEKKDTPTE
jgi:hypothetical protein